MPPGVNITSTTNQYLLPAWINGVLRDNAFMREIMQKTERWRGSQVVVPIRYQKGTASVAFNGFDVLPITQVPTTVNATFYPAFVATNIALAGTDLSVNKAEGNGTLKTLDLMEQTMKARSQDAADDLGNYFQGDGTSNGGKAPMGLLGIVDDGTTLSSYGGLSRATYTALNATRTNSSGTISLLKVRTLWNSISDGSVRPDVIHTDYTTWGYFEQLLTPFQRNTITSFEASAMSKAHTASASGYADLVWDGMKIYRDRKVTSGYFYMINTEFTKFHGLNWWEGSPISPVTDKIKGTIYQGTGFSKAFTWTGWIKAYNMGAINGYIITGGQLISENPWRNGVLYGVTGV